MKKRKILYHGLVVCLMTLLTQTGGAIWLTCLGLRSLLPVNPYPRSTMAGLFLVVYSLCSLCIIPILAPFVGRVPLPVFEGPLLPKNVIACYLNRHYIDPALKPVLEQKAIAMAQKFPGSKLYYLEANFPFADGFPLLPHRSHDDGKKVDLCFFYKTKSGEQTNLKPSRSGYGVFEGPTKEEQNTTDFCKGKGYFQYDYPKFLTLGRRDDLIFDELRTTELVRLLVHEKTVKKVFLEPHLKERLGLNGESKIRFQGCKAVRHDDHIHVEFSK